MKFKFKNLFMLVLASAITLSCSSDRKDIRKANKIPTATEVKISEDIDDSQKVKELDLRISELEKKLKDSNQDEKELLAELGELQKQRKSLSAELVSISKELLNSEVLFHVVYTSSTTAANPMSFSSKVVNLEIKGDKLVVKENLDSKLQTNDIETEKVEFILPIEKISEDKVYVDFSKGLNFVSLIDNFDSSEEETTYKISDSYIKKQVNYDDGGLMVDSVTMMDLGEDAFSAGFKLTFEKLIKNNDFVPTKNSDLEKHNIRFFESSRVWEAGKEEPSVFAAKWDTSKEVVWHYSRNFPEEYMGVLEQSIAYWNNAFGKDVLKLEKLPEGIEPNDRGYNVIQWLSWDAAGSARADFKSNPRTGELLQATLHITSVFVKGEQFRQTVDRHAGKSTSDNVSKSLDNLKPAHSHGAIHCNKDHSKAIALENLKLESLKDYSEEELKGFEQGLKEKYLAETIAHEIGHALGLRHNFASSAQSELKPDEYTEQLATLIEKEKLLNKNVATSTMDYTRLYDAVQAGHRVLMADPMDYDLKAIKYAYSGIPENPSEKEKSILFCSDEEADGIIDDCRRFDRYGNRIADQILETSLRVGGKGPELAKSMIDYEKEKAGLISKKKNEDGIEVDRAKPMDLATYGSKIFENYIGDILISLDNRTTLLSADKNQDGLNIISSDEAKKIRQDQVDSLELREAAIFALIVDSRKQLIDGFKAEIENMEADSDELKAIKEKLNGQLQANIDGFELGYMSAAIGSIAGMKYDIKDAEAYMGGLNLLTDLVMNKKSDEVMISKETMSELETMAEVINKQLTAARLSITPPSDYSEVRKPYYDKISDGQLRIAYMSMLASNPPLYSASTFSMLMAPFSGALVEKQGQEYFYKYSPANMSAWSNIGLAEQTSTEQTLYGIMSSL